MATKQKRETMDIEALDFNNSTYQIRDCDGDCNLDFAHYSNEKMREFDYCDALISEDYESFILGQGIGFSFDKNKTKII